MANVFDSVLNFVQMISSFVTNIVHGLLAFIGMIPDALEVTTVSIGVLPTAFVAFATVGVLICVVFMIIGR